MTLLRDAQHLEVMNKLHPRPKPVRKLRKPRYNGIKITPADKWFSLCVRERCGWICERCGTDYSSQAPTSAFHCSHVEGRGNWATRLDPLDAFGLCYGCHRFIGGRTVSHQIFYINHNGQAKWDLLREKSENIELGKLYRETQGKGEIAKHYKTEFERMQELRANGVQGRIEFKGWL